jgi:hypothetical protein
MILQTIVQGSTPCANTCSEQRHNKIEHYFIHGTPLLLSVSY